MIKINISKEFSETPGGRKIAEGKFSGEEFREKILKNKYEEAVEKGEKLEINFDNCFGFASSFLEEAFGGMIRVHNKVGILNNIIIVSKDDETLEETIIKYVKAAEETLKRGIKK